MTPACIDQLREQYKQWAEQFSLEAIVKHTYEQFERRRNR